jgi:hypothetical protein
MSYERIQSAIQVHLAEFSTLRQELLEVLKWRDQLVLLSLGISGALFSFAFSGEHTATMSTFRRLALYLVAPLAAVIGSLWLVSAWRIARIGMYIRDQLAPKVNQLLVSSGGEHGSAFDLLGWESSAERLEYKWPRRLCEWIGLLSAFVLPGVVAQFVIFSETAGSLGQRVRELDSPTMFCFNCALIGSSLALFLLHLYLGKIPRPSSTVLRS